MAAASVFPRPKKSIIQSNQSLASLVLLQEELNEDE